MRLRRKSPESLGRLIFPDRNELIECEGLEMKGVVFLGDRELEFREIPDHKPGPGKVVSAMKGSGLCGRDL